MQICEIYIYLNYQLAFILTNLFMWMNLAATNVLGLGGLAGLPLVLLRSRLLSSNARNDTRYSLDGISFARVFQGSTDIFVFEDFIEQLLPLCGRWPEPKSVLVMDNASFHHTERIEQRCYNAGVKIIYLPPYSPNLNSIEEYFAEAKAFIVYEADPSQGFDEFPEWCIDIVERKEQGAKGHFRHVGLTIEEL